MGNAYKCPAGVWTIGFGHTKGVKEGDKITREKASDLLLKDLDIFSPGVEKAIGVEGMKHTTENQFSAMVSLAYNIGLSAFESSSVLRKHKEKNYDGAAYSFLLWNKAGGKVLNGLVHRREMEKWLYLSRWDK
jgi:lysozyme